MRTFRFQEILNKLAELDSWLVRLGIEPRPNDRIHHAINVVQRAESAWQSFRVTREPTKVGNIDDYYFGMTEALEFSDVFDAFHNDPPEILRPKLQRALEGPLRPKDETQRNAEGRNTMFELALAADLRLRGARVTIGDPDITMYLMGTDFLIECKRPSADHSIRANVRDAVRQLQKKLDRAGCEEARGMVAVSLSRILNPGTKIFVGRSEAQKEQLGDQLAASMRQHEPDWAKADLHPRITAVMFQATTPAAIGNEEQQKDSLVRLGYITVMPAGRDEKGFLTIQEALPPLLNY